MSINYDYYQQIINDYPEYVTKEQFYKIAHISKKTAQYLLQSKKVPCIENDKKTRKYKIKVSDIVAYMIDRELRPGYYRPGYSSTKISSVISPDLLLRRKTNALTKEELCILRFYLAKEFENINDLFTISEISNLFGIQNNIISRRCTTGDIFSFLIRGKRMVPKVCLVNYLSSPKGFSLIGRSLLYDFLLSNFCCKKDSIQFKAF